MMQSFYVSELQWCAAHTRSENAEGNVVTTIAVPTSIIFLPIKRYRCHKCNQANFVIKINVNKKKQYYTLKYY